MRLAGALSVILSIFSIADGSRNTSCIEDDKIRLEGSCDRYSVCVDGVWHSRLCPDSNFDPQSKTCRKIPCSAQVCIAVGDKLVEESNDCSSYFTCLPNGKLEKQFCHWLQRFDVNMKSCQWWFKVDCTEKKYSAESSGEIKIAVEGSGDKFKNSINKKSEVIRCDAGQTFDSATNKCVKLGKSLNSQEKCDEDRLKPVTGSCDKYYRCVDGRRTEEGCPYFERFDVRTLSCDYMWRADCGLGTECKTGDKAPSGICTEYYQCEYGYWKRRDCGTAVGLQMYFDETSKDCMIVGSRCSDVACSVEGLKKALPTDCSKYQICHEGRFYEKSCGYMKKFDVERSECGYFVEDCSRDENIPVCMDGKRTSVDDSCYAYKECVDGHFKTKYCLYPLYRFDKESLSCTFMAQCNTRCYEGEINPIPGNCDQFYSCRDSKYIIQTCPPTTAFDVVTNSCIDSKYATCG